MNSNLGTKSKLSEILKCNKITLISTTYFELIRYDYVGNDKIESLVKINSKSKLHKTKPNNKYKIKDICIGGFLYLLKCKYDMEILYHNESIPKLKCKPDIVFTMNDIVYHIEIDRYLNKCDKEIVYYFIRNYGSYVLFKFNPYYGDYDKSNIVNAFVTILKFILNSKNVDESKVINCDSVEELILIGYLLKYPINILPKYIGHESELIVDNNFRRMFIYTDVTYSKFIICDTVYTGN